MRSFHTPIRSSAKSLCCLKFEGARRASSWKLQSKLRISLLLAEDVSSAEEARSKERPYEPYDPSLIRTIQPYFVLFGKRHSNNSSQDFPGMHLVRVLYKIMTRNFPYIFDQGQILSHDSSCFLIHMCSKSVSSLSTGVSLITTYTLHRPMPGQRRTCRDRDRIMCEYKKVYSGKLLCN